MREVCDILAAHVVELQGPYLMGDNDSIEISLIGAWVPISKQAQSYTRERNYQVDEAGLECCRSKIAYSSFGFSPDHIFTTLRFTTLRIPRSLKGSNNYCSLLLWRKSLA